MASGTSSRYALLWDVSDHTPAIIDIFAYDAVKWPGPPANPISPNPITVNMKRYLYPIKPVVPLVGRHTRRGGGYVSLTNYNNLP
jgi:hypothetical protein